VVTANGREERRSGSNLGCRGGAAGVTVPLVDVIFACAKLHGLDVAHDDAHFDDLAKLAK
jgi:hypothetical protein